MRGDFQRFLCGHGIDIGCGNDVLTVDQGLVDGWDVGNGDAQYLHGIPDVVYDFVYSSHCLEHLADVSVSLTNWVRTLKPGGAMYLVVPDYALYEKMRFPSRFNPDHKQTFSLDLTRDQVRRANHWHIGRDLRPLLVALGIDIAFIALEDERFDYNIGPEVDQTAGDGALAQICVVGTKTCRSMAHLDNGGSGEPIDRVPSDDVRQESKNTFCLLMGIPRVVDPSHQSDIEECLAANLDNPLINRIFVFFEAPLALPLLAHPKVRMVPSGRPLTFQDAGSFARSHLKGITCIVADAGVSFGTNLLQIDRAYLHNSCFALACWDIQEAGTLRAAGDAEGPGAWLFVSPLPDLLGDTLIGSEGCGARIAADLAQAGIRLVDPGPTVRACRHRR